VTFNKHNTYEWFRRRIYKLEETPHDPGDFHAAMDAAMTWGDKIPIGLVYRNPNPRPSLHVQDPGLQPGVLVHQPVGVSPQHRRKMIEEFM
jgi:2-oxoglutarate ferredoxin oxidoreductase subunit beta